MSIEVRFTEEDWQRTEKTWQAWWAGELDRPLSFFTTWDDDGKVFADAPGFVTNLPMDMDLEEVVDRYQRRLEHINCYGDAFPHWWPNFGPGTIAGFLGAKIGIQLDTVWFDPAEAKAPAEMHLEVDRQNAYYTRILELTRIAAARWGKNVSVGITDIGGNLDILVGLRSTEKLLMDLIDCPGEVERLGSEITQIWLEYYEDFYAAIEPANGCTGWPAIWAPGRFYMLQCDFSYMISPGMFERFVLPDLTACCDHLDYGFYHMDGKGQLPHLDYLLSIERLRGIQWIPGAGQPEAAEWPDVLSRIRKAGKLCQVCATPQGAKKIVRDHGGKGFMFIIQNDEKDDLTAETFPDFLTELEKLERK